MLIFDLTENLCLLRAGSGVGARSCAAVSAEGAKVALLARSQAELDETVKNIRRNGGVAYGIVADVGDKESVYPVVGQVALVDILINYASPLGLVPLRLFTDPDCENFERALQVNTIGPFRLIKAGIGSMILRQTGIIVNISSNATVETWP
jgi:NAD(P)-dependent dehydrogenase (short-subunit alcohol dehydrogenase family)